MAASTPTIERLLRIIDEGRRTATYKLALLLALMDVVITNPGVEVIPTRTLATRVLEIYFDQSRPFVQSDGTAGRLRQINMADSAVLRAVHDLRDLADAERLRSVDQLRRSCLEDYDRALDTVEKTFVRYPIPLLQVVGGNHVPFLYDITWNEGAAMPRLRRSGHDHVTLRPGVADELNRLSPLLRPLVELHWLRDVARWSRIAVEDQRLLEHLFGSQRVSLPIAVRNGLVDLQRGTCFYCDQPLNSVVEIDHFVAWSRWPNDSIENLVAADRCNGHKSDHLAAHDHALKWTERNDRQASDLAAVALESNWKTDPIRSFGLASSTYGAIPAGTPLWLREREFVDQGPLRLSDPQSLQAIHRSAHDRRP